MRGQLGQSSQTYVFRARKAQDITVALVPDGGDKGTLTFTLYAYCGEAYGAPLASEALRWQGKLPCNDRYTIDVSPSREAAALARTQRYALTLTIQ